MVDFKGLFLSKEKKKELEKELKNLETVSRKEISEKLAEARELSLSDDDQDLIMVIEEKERLETRIAEIRALLFKARVTKDECLLHADVGSEVVLAHDKEVIVFKLVSSVEIDPTKNKISVESKIGQLLKGKKVGDKVKITNPEGIEIEYRVLYLC